MNALLLAAEGGANSLWDPTIKGILVVVCAVVLFCGSSYLLLATNMGSRQGFLVAFTGLMGFMIILSTLWLVTDQPITSFKGREATWQPVEVVTDTAKAKTEAVRNAEDGRLNANHDFDHRIADAGDLLTQFSTGQITEAQLNEKLKDDKARAQEILALGGLIEQDQATIKAALEGAVIAPAPGAHEAAAPAKIPGLDGQFAEAADELSLPATARFFGGDSHSPNPLRLEFTHAPLFATMEFCKAAPTPDTFPDAPPPPTCEPGTTKTLVLARDLGSLRLRSFSTWVISILLFGLGLFLLNYRERQTRARAAEGELSETGAKP